MVQIAQELYRVVLFAVFMAQTYLAGLLPVIGTPWSYLQVLESNRVHAATMSAIGLMSLL